MATAPQISFRDNSGYTTSLTLTTNQDNIVLRGTVEATTISVQVSINGGEFVSDPNLIQVVDTTFTIPNQDVYPSGLPLEFGVNTILIRAVDLVGSVSSISTAVITRLENVDFSGTQIPTGIKVERHRDFVTVLAAKPKPLQNLSQDDQGNPVLVTTTLSDFLGFNIYGSTSPAGASGYLKLNSKLLNVATRFEQSDVQTINDIGLWDAGVSKVLRVRVSEENEFGTETDVRLDMVHDNSLMDGKLEFIGSLRNYSMNEYVVFNHYRTGAAGQLNSDQFFGIPSNDPVYYVVTGVYWDKATGTEVETPYSQEVLGTPLSLDTTIRDLPSRTSRSIVQSYVDAIQRVDAKISLIPLSVTRDVMIDPFASEAARLWFLLDFVHRSQSFLTLLAIDNVSGNGVSDPVVSSAYKTALKSALGATTDSSVQGLIDQQFDKLAGNVNETRQAGRQALGTLTLYTTTRPTKNLTIPSGSYALSTADSSSGITSQRFRIAGSYVLPSSNAEAYYNFDTKRYEIKVSILAEQAGSAGNVAPGNIQTLVGVSGLKAINETPTVFGRDLESNAELASRAMLKFASVDTGTGAGYLATSADQIGIVRSKVVQSGDALMMRDYDDVRGKHIGGKVDIWVQGLQERQVSDTFSFTFAVAQNVQCQILDSVNLVFQVIDSRVSNDTPLVEILDVLSQGLGVRNITSGLDYDLTGVTILSYNTFKLNTLIPQPATGIDDIVLADFRYQAVNKLYMTLQPVRRVVSVVGEVSGTLTEGTHYRLVKTDDPLLEGESTRAQNHIEITPSGGIPSGATITVNNEEHVMIGFEREPLGSIGINIATIRVFSEDRLTEFDGPSAAAPDFEIIQGTPTTPARIVRTAASTIANGQKVSVDYTHDENFKVTYVINQLLQQLQSVISAPGSAKRHVTADVLVKQAVQNSIDLETTVQLKQGASKETSDPAIRGNVALDLSKNLIGEGSAQSNVDAEINNSIGVAKNVLPMAKMAYSDGSIKLRESVLSTAVRVSSLDFGGNLVYILTNPVNYPTTDGGGLATEHRGVFLDDVAMKLSSSLGLVGSETRQAYIIGSGGAVISGYSDDATLGAAGFLPIQYEAERLRRTANHVVVSLSGSGLPLDLPTDHDFTVSYVIRGDSGSHDITVSDIEVVELGDFVITYRNYTGA